MRAERILRQNIDAILRARGQTRAELAAHCGLTRSWASRVFSDRDRHDKRGIPLKYLDAFADFFGIAVYQLFQPGISALTERRAGAERRTLADRRLTAALRGAPTEIRRVPVTPDDELVLADLHALDYEDYQRVKGWIAVARLGVGRGRKTRPVSVPPAAATGAPASTPSTNGRRRGK